MFNEHIDNNNRMVYKGFGGSKGEKVGWDSMSVEEFIVAVKSKFGDEPKLIE